MSEPLWTSEEAAQATGGRACGTWRANGISIDTRTLQPGDLFVALQGDARDGHAFVADALHKGAAAALIARRPGDVAADAPLLVCADTLEGLRALGVAARARSTGKIAAVTGSVGKTSTKEALRTVLSAFGAVHAAAASYNNHWGVPLTLARMPRAAAFGVIEIGMNHPGEIAPLSALAKPHCALVTTVEAVHLENFTSVEAIADEKAAIFTGLAPGGIAVVNMDNPHGARVADHARAAGAGAVWRFGTSEGCEARLIDADLDPEGSTVTAALFGTAITFRIGVPGAHFVMNGLGALLTAHGVGVPVADAAAQFVNVAPVGGRGARSRVVVPGGEATLIDESYNANPSSMRAAIALLAQTPTGRGGKRIAVLGDMLELGPQAPALHAGLAAALSEAKIDRVFACGPLMEHLFEALPQARRGAHAPHSQALAPLVAESLRAGDVIMVKGSFGSRMRIVIEALKAPQAT
ncbi:MAG: UDP-N-acetylmuramoylalanyl-D-glutamyl-2,6-diaminopimelate--D-alanyl-D-alanine ligase [Alphaproteobacteria bacterium]|nr:UDP-N-acetylmuramoylalanyl-D-glutamyl-2,6-diaminopimelate--D-alanyl-D-alanine ligase [Alphaproteobacteria bacterium]